MTNMGAGEVLKGSLAPAPTLLERLGGERRTWGWPLPGQVIRLALLGQEEGLLSCRTVGAACAPAPDSALLGRLAGGQGQPLRKKNF